jgi:hypothetical protein
VVKVPMVMFDELNADGKMPERNILEDFSKAAMQ